jgi:hypothetical protein
MSRLAQRVRTQANARLFRRVAGRLSSKESTQLEALLAIEPGSTRVKQLPKCSICKLSWTTSPG